MAKTLPTANCSPRRTCFPNLGKLAFLLLTFALAPAVATAAPPIEVLESEQDRLADLTEISSTLEGRDRRALELRLEGLFESFRGDLARAIDEAGTEPDAGLLEVLGQENTRLRERVLTLVRDLAATEKAHLAAEPESRLSLVEDLALQQRRLLDTLEDQFELAVWQRALGLDPSAELAEVDRTLRAGTEVLAGRVLLSLEELKDIEVALRTAGTEEVAALRERKKHAELELDVLAGSLERATRLLENRGLPHSDFDTLLQEVGDQEPSLTLDGHRIKRLVSRGIRQLTTWLTDEGPGWLVKILLFLLILLIARRLAKTMRGLVQRGLDKSKIQGSTLLQEYAVSLSGQAVLLIGALVALSQIGIDLGPLLAGMGIVGFVVGFALQDSLSNFAAGVMILLYQPFDVGDVVEAAGVTGKITHVSLVSTSFVTFDNQSIVVPNRKVWGDTIKNVNDLDVRRVDMVFGCSYDDDVDRAREVLAEILKTHELVLEEPEAVVKMHALADSSINFVVRPWTKTADYWAVYWDVTRAVKKRFDEEGISIPYPQRDVHLYPTGDARDS